MDNFIFKAITPEIYSEVLLLWQECNIRIEAEDDLAHFVKFCSNNNGKGFIALESVGKIAAFPA